MSAPSLPPVFTSHLHYYELIRHSLKTSVIPLPHWAYRFPSDALSELPLFHSEPSLRSCHLYAGSPSWQLIGYIYMTCPFGYLTPPVLSYNRVSYDTSTVVHSHLIHLLRPHLITIKKNQPLSFPQRSIPDREGQAPCGGLTSEPILSLPKGQADKKKSALFHLNYSIVDLQRTIYLVPLIDIQSTQIGLTKSFGLLIT